MAKQLVGQRRQAVCAWLTANGINPNDVPADAEMSISDIDEGRLLRCDMYVRSRDGHLQVDERGEKIAMKVVTVPLKVEPPTWWEPHVKPTRDDLLATVERLRNLIAADPDVTAENVDGWNWAMQAVEAVLDGKERR